MGVRISWLMLARKRLLACVAASAWSLAAASFNSNCLCEAIRHQPSMKELELAEIAFVIIGGLVADAGHGHDPVAVEHGNVHVPDDGHMSFRRAVLVRIRRGVVVRDDRLALTHRLAPKSGLFHRVHDGLVDHFAGSMGRLGPVLHGEHGFVLVHHRQVADVAFRQTNGLLDDGGVDLLHRPVGHVA